MRREPPWAVRRHARPLDAFLTNGRRRLAAAGMAGASCTADNGCDLSMRVQDRDVDIEPDDTLPSVEITMRFLALCDRYGSEEAAVAAIAGGAADWRAGVTAPRRLAGLERARDEGSGRLPSRGRCRVD